MLAMDRLPALARLERGEIRAAHIGNDLEIVLADGEPVEARPIIELMLTILCWPSGDFSMRGTAATLSACAVLTLKWNASSR